MEQEPEISIFDNLHDPFAVRRKNMLPGWIRFFCWIFAVLCSITVLIEVMALLTNLPNSFSVYGLDATSLMSLSGIISILITVLKGTTAISLLAEKDWAVKLGIAEGIVGIIFLIYTMATNNWVDKSFGGLYVSYNFGNVIQLFFIIAFLVKMIRIRPSWEENRYARQQAVNP
jgi:hypothetical protein